MHTPKKTRKDAFFSLLKEMSERLPYVHYTDIKMSALERGIIQNEKTLKDYLGDSVGRGGLNDAGKGWYSRLSNPVTLDPESVAEVKTLLTERFPLLPFYAWSTQQLNPWMHHLFGKFVTFITVDADGAHELAEYLRDRGWQVYLNPTKSGTDFVIRDKTAIVRGVNRALDLDNEPTIETILDELLAENRRLGFMDAEELHTLAGNLVSQHRLEVSKLFRLLGDRKLAPEELFGREIVNYFGINEIFREE
jgi:hypothetical protein